ncbi:MAG: Sapep family Mn(2+)-dependent dipeptidase [Oscillospiraceae bacterium]|nr:Sapep family Mn(2+)-dependent dipeptidase [Oscillospiraceae bacterium]
MLRKQIEEYFKAHRDEMLGDIKTLVAIRSVSGAPDGDKPFGAEPARALETALTLAKKYGFEQVANIDNYVGTVEIGEGEAKLGMLAHLDVVPEGSGWTECGPFDGAEKDGKLFGRGVSDDKGPAITALYAMRCIKDLGLPVKNKVRLILGTSEETGSQDIEYYFKHYPTPPMVFSPDGEYPILNIEKGQLRPEFDASFAECKELPRIKAISGGTVLNAVPPLADAEVEGMSAADVRAYFAEVEKRTGASFEAEDVSGGTKITCHGANAHASTPAQGVNAITAIIEMLCGLPLAPCGGIEKLRAVRALMPHGETDGKSLGIACGDDISGSLTASLDIFSYDGEKLNAKIDSRVPICGGEERLFAILKDKAEKAGITARLVALEHPHHTDENSELVRELKKVYSDYTGLEAKCIYMGGGTYVHNIDGGVGFGCEFPGVDTHMHGPDEFVRIDDLIVSGEMFAQIIADLCC